MAEILTPSVKELLWQDGLIFEKRMDRNVMVIFSLFFAFRRGLKSFSDLYGICSILFLQPDDNRVGISCFRWDLQCLGQV